MAHKTIKGKTPHLSSALGGGAAVLPAAHRTEHDGNNNLSLTRQVTINCNHHPERRS